MITIVLLLYMCATLCDCFIVWNQPSSSAIPTLGTLGPCNLKRLTSSQARCAEDYSRWITNIWYCPLYESIIWLSTRCVHISNWSWLYHSYDKSLYVSSQSAPRLDCELKYYMFFCICDICMSNIQLLYVFYSHYTIITIYLSKLLYVFYLLFERNFNYLMCLLYVLYPLNVDQYMIN